MPHATLSAVVARAARAATPAEPEHTDGRLLTRFVATRDEEAFAELVRRAGPMVLGVCRRVTGDSHLADDAFQAAFLVLARRAADVRPREAVRGWLYGIAVRVAQKARTMSARRRSREVPVPAVPDREQTRRAVGRRGPVRPGRGSGSTARAPAGGGRAVRTRRAAAREAAARLGIPAGTLSSRLAKARKLLADRLRKRGVALPAAGLGVLAPASIVSAQLASATSALITSAAAIPPEIAALTTGVFRTMLFQKLSATVATLLLASFALATVNPPPGSPPKPSVPVRLTVAAPVQPTPLPVGPNKILLLRPDGLTLMEPTGKKSSKLPISVRVTRSPLDGVRLSPDGKQVAFIAPFEIPNDPLPGEEPPWMLFVAGIDDKEPQCLGVSPRSFAWSPDGTQIAYTEFPPGGKNWPPSTGSSP